MLHHLSLRLRVFLLFALLAGAASALLVLALILGYVRLGDPAAVSSFVIAGFISVLALVGISAWIWLLFDENVAKPIEQMAGDLRARVHSDVDTDFDTAQAAYLGDLAPAAASVARNLFEIRKQMDDATARETTRLSRQNANLQAVLAEIPDAVAFCTADHRITLYNAALLAIADTPEAVGLNRPLADLLNIAPLNLAYERLTKNTADTGADVLVTCRASARLLEARMRLLHPDQSDPNMPKGYVLTLRDVSGDLPVHAERAHLLNAALAAVPDGPVATELAKRKAETDTKWWPMETLTGGDLTAAVATRLARKAIDLSTETDGTTLRCDGFAITRLLERLALAWTNAGAIDLHLRHAATTLTLSASDIAPDAVAQWLQLPLAPGSSGFSGEDVLISHGTTLEAESTPTGHALHLTLPGGPTQVEQSHAASPVIYDFNLPSDPLTTALDALNFVVFDTETTGLNTTEDEICQIAAVRIVNGRVLRSERLDLLVNPGRSIPASATAIHGITDQMVADALPVADAVARFHAFAKDTVLIAHNAPFDMAFLRRQEPRIGLDFDQPVLDTVLCSAILFGQTAQHTLDALCARVGVHIPEADRHTAFGDTIATARAMVRLIPMLRDTGIETLDQLLLAFDRHKRLIPNLNSKK